MLTSQECTTPESASKKNRVQLDHLLIDVDFFDKPKVRALIYKHSQLSALLYMRWLMLMSRATNALVTRDALFSIAKEVLSGMGTAIATPESVLSYCLKTEMLTQVSDDSFTNERVVKDQESCAIKREAAAKRQEKFKSKDTPTVNALPTRLPDTVTDTEDLNTEDLKKEEKETVKQLSTITPEAWNAVKRWAAHRKKLCLAFDSMAAEALQMQYAGRSDALIRDINASITANSRNIFQAALPEAERIKIAATAKAEVLKPVEPQRPKPKPFVPLSEPIEPVKAETMAECRRKIQEITRLATPKVSV